MNTEEFDDIIRKKVDQPIQAEDPRAWDMFMLSAIERGEEFLFEDTSTDELVKKSLDDFTVEYDHQSWESLSKKLDLTEVESEPVIVQAKFDKVVSNSLKGITRKYDAATWPKLAARIEAEEKYLKHYYRAKAIEALLFCLLILTVYQFVKSGRLTPPSLLSPKNEETAYNSSPQNPIEAAVMTDLVMQEKITTTHSTPSTGSIKLSASKIVAITDLNLDRQTTEREFFQFAHLGKTTIQKQASIRFPVNQDLSNKIKDLLIPKSSGLLVEEVENNLTEMPIRRTLKVASKLAASLAGVWKFGMYTHADYNEIYLPDQYLLVYGIKSPLYSATTVNSIGYGAGFKAHYLKKRIGGEVGIGYSKRAYSPNRKYYLDPLWNIDFKRFEYDIIEMPISVKYTSKNNTRLRTYAMVGVNANFITKAIYDVLPEIKQVRYGNSNDALVLTPDQNIIKNRVEDQFTILDKRRALLYGQGSIGAEWKVNQKIDIYSQLTYGQRVLTKQFGPNWDQFRSLSLEMGVKTSIN